MKRLTAQRPILYGGRMYQAGDTLPAYDKRMVQAWLSAESAKMTDDAAEEAATPARHRERRHHPGHPGGRGRHRGHPGRPGGHPGEPRR